MFAIGFRPVRLFGLCGLLLAASTTATAKKPPPDDPPPLAPVLYQVLWLDGLSDDTSTHANDINIAGTIVGSSVDEAGTRRAVCWRFNNGWAPEDLNECVADSLDGGYLSSAVCISNAGLIAGTYKDADGISRVYVCDPDVGELWILDYDYDSFWFSIRDMNVDGTVVGYFVNGADVDQRQGFVWHYNKGFLLLPEDHEASAINDADVVVGIITAKRITNGEIFRLQVDWEQPDSTADIEGLGGLGFLGPASRGRPAISSDGTIAASPWRLLPGPDEDWEEFAEGIDYWWCGASDINAQGQICGVLTLRKPRDFEPGFVYDAQAQQFWILDDRIVHDDTSLWASGIVIPMAVADEPADEPDESVFTAYEGFSTIVGWQDGCGGFVLVPGSLPE